MLKVLIVDDTKSVHAFVKSLLSRAPSLSTVSVFNGAEAIDHLQAGNKYDLILLDWEMPILDGPGTMARLKKLGYKTPVLMMTTKNRSEDIEHMLAQGISEYMMKPFTADILFEKIEFVTNQTVPYAAE